MRLLILFPYLLVFLTLIAAIVGNYLRVKHRPRLYIPPRDAGPEVSSAVLILHLRERQEQERCP